MIRSRIKKIDWITVVVVGSIILMYVIGAWIPATLFLLTIIILCEEDRNKRKLSQ